MIADRLGRRQVMLAADLLRTASQALLAALLFAGHPPIWAFAVLAGIVGVGDAFFTPAFNGLVVEIAPTDELGDANLPLSSGWAFGRLGPSRAETAGDFGAVAVSGPGGGVG